MSTGDETSKEVSPREDRNNQWFRFAAQVLGVALGYVVARALGL